MAEPPVGEILGKYRLLRLLGEGGMGQVFLGLDPLLQREVAIKVIRADEPWAAKALQRFVSEARALARLSSPYLVQVYEFNFAGARPYLVMELVRGRNLQELLDCGAAFSAGQLVSCAWQVLAGLSEAHRARVLHRDIKPGNILLAQNGVYKLADFGLAREQDLQVGATSRGRIVGTVEYLAPEMICGEPASTRTDLYALAVTLYEAACGQLPFTERNTLELLQRIASKPLPPLRDRRPDLPVPLLDWFGKLSAHDPQDRYSDAEAAFAALKEVANQLDRGERKEPASSAPWLPAVAPETAQSAAEEGGEETPTADVHSAPLQSAVRRAPPLRLTSGLPRRPFALKLWLAMGLLTSAFMLLASFLLYRNSLARETERWHNELEVAAATAAGLIDGDRFAALRRPEQQGNEDYNRIKRLLAGFQEHNPRIKYIYTLAPAEREGLLQFVVDPQEPFDADGDGEIGLGEKGAALGEPYNALRKAPLMLEGLKQVCSEEEPLPDKWGLTLSGYAPIYNSRGVSVGVVGVDVAGERVQMLRREFFWNAAGITGLSLLASLLGTLLVTRWFNRPVRKLLKGIRDLEAGNLEARVRLRTKDEFEILAEAFNGLAAGLREREAIRLAFERYVSREMSEHLLRRRQTSLAMTAEKVTFLYCDMAGCTHLAAPGERAKGAAFLNALMPRLLDAIFRYGGTAERVVDDGLLAVFGVGHQSPQQQEELAIRAALEAQFALHDVSEGLGLTKLRMGAGLHTMTLDPGASGTGATQQAALAQGAEWVMRLGRANRRLGTYILAEENVLRSVRHLFHVVPYPEVRMRMGRPPVTLFSIVGAISPGLPAEDKLLAAAKASGKSGPRPAV